MSTEFRLMRPRQKIRVCSKTMSKASPVFKSMLSPHFAEGTKLRTAGSIDLKLNEDKPASMIIICRIAHLQNRFVPSSMSVPQLLDISEMCDKYDFREMLSMHAAQWITSALEVLRAERNKNARGDREDLLVAAYSFGNAAMFAKCGEGLITEIESNSRNLPPSKSAGHLEILDKIFGMGTLSERDIFFADFMQMLSLPSASGYRSG